MTIKHIGAVSFLLACAACSTGMDAMVNTMQAAVRRTGDSANARLSPNFRYLKVAIQGRVAFVALGYEDDHQQGPIEVWYSANKEVLRLQNGRVAGATGLTTEWRSVSLDQAPPWSSVARASQPTRWIRTRDVMPGYRFGVRDELELRAISAPQNVSLQGIESQRLIWFEERIVPSVNSATIRAAAEPGLAPARYAVDFQGDQAIVVYGEQCLAPALCFAWQRWKP